MAIVAWSPLYDQATTSGTYSQVDGKMPRLNSIKRVVRRDGFRTWRALYDQLIGAATGGTAAATHKRIAGTAAQGDVGGLRTVEVVTDINRVTTAGDVTDLKNVIDTVKVQPTSYPRDLSGNGGPAFTPVQ
jgi:hypothetical protein